MVNTVELEDGEQLCLEVQDRVQKEVAPKRDWKQAHKQQEVTNVKAQKRNCTDAAGRGSDKGGLVGQGGVGTSNHGQGKAQGGDWLGVAGRPGNGNGGP